MSALWICVGALTLYGVFFLWYNSRSSPLTSAEIDSYMKRMEASPDPPDAERLAAARAFLEADDGGEFFMLNLIRLQPSPVPTPGSGELQPAQRVLEEYTGYFMPALIRRAGHPSFIGAAAGGYLEHWGVEKNPGWTFSGVVRYRSRRDLMELATDPAFDSAHAYKMAAMANTLAIPLAPGRLFFGPRVWVALSLALVACLGQLALGL